MPGSRKDYNKLHHDEIMKKYYSTPGGQKRLTDQIQDYKNQMKILDAKMHDLNKFRSVNSCKADCKPNDIEMLPDRILVCAKVECDYRIKKPSDSLMGVLSPHPTRPVIRDTKLRYSADID